MTKASQFTLYQAEGFAVSATDFSDDDYMQTFEFGDQSISASSCTQPAQDWLLNHTFADGSHLAVHLFCWKGEFRQTYPNMPQSTLDDSSQPWYLNANLTKVDPATTSFQTSEEALGASGDCVKLNSKTGMCGFASECTAIGDPHLTDFSGVT